MGKKRNHDPGLALRKKAMAAFPVVYGTRGRSWAAEVYVYPEVQLQPVSLPLWKRSLPPCL